MFTEEKKDYIEPDFAVKKFFVEEIMEVSSGDDNWGGGESGL